MYGTVSKPINRRKFLQQAGIATGTGVAPRAFAAPPRRILIVLDSDDRTVLSAPVSWAAEELRRALASFGAAVDVRTSLDRAPAADACVFVTGPSSPSARAVLGSSHVVLPESPESLALATGRLSGREVVLACGRDTRGIVYALLELSDRVGHGSDVLESLRILKPAVEQPANRIRCISRAFCSDVEDKPWYNDREMWPEYFRMLLTNRFNRFNLTLGLAYDFMRNVSDCYFHFAYPFLVSVPGYDVKAVGLPDAERDHNLEMLRFISDSAAARGLQFQLGVWDHAYEWTDSPKANYTHTGLTPANHGPYCRDALKMILQKCPGITGVTIRIHGESGVAEGNYDFWKTIFDGVASCGRRVEIDLHAKGIDEKMIETALSTGMPVMVAPKYWAEHIGLPYHQAAIRELERAPRESAANPGLFALSNGERRFTRYGYADLMKENRKYGILYRMFPGGRRVLLWGDPVTAEGYGRVSSFCGSDGVDFMEPLYFKGRRGSGVAGNRCSYADASLVPRWDWQKFEYTYRVWGRHLYNPDADSDVWRRYTRRKFGAAASSTEEALAQATRVLQVICTVHGASGAHNRYWPEMYTNMSIVEPDNTYGDTPSPKRFGTVSPFDPELFLTIDETAEELLRGRRSGKYTQAEAAQWLEEYATGAIGSLEKAEVESGGRKTVEFRRLAIDVAIQARLGRFFGAKIRSAILWRLYDRSGDRRALEQALRLYRTARSAWAELADIAGPVYMSNVSYGQEKYLSGHWKDRLPAIDEDVARMAGLLEKADRQPQGTDARRVEGALAQAAGVPARLSVACSHKPPAGFKPGAALEITLEPPSGAGALDITLRYRHANQAETYQQTEMRRVGGAFRATIPAAYTSSPYPLVYYFVIREGQEKAGLFPGFRADRANQPYFVVRQS